MSLAGTKTADNLKAALQSEAFANRRYLCFAHQADMEGYNEAAALFRSTADGEAVHAQELMDKIKDLGDPLTGMPIGTTECNLKAAIAGETHEYTHLYPSMAATAREEGLDDIAEWFETLAKAERSHANSFQKLLSELDL